MFFGGVRHVGPHSIWLLSVSRANGSAMHLVAKAGVACVHACNATTGWLSSRAASAMWVLIIHCFHEHINRDPNFEACWSKAWGRELQKARALRHTGPK